jgi:hypothetical protein
MYSPTPYAPQLSFEAAVFITTLPKRHQRRVLALIDRLATNPTEVADFHETDAQGRSVESLVLENFLFTYWVDHASKEVCVVDIAVI